MMHDVDLIAVIGPVEPDLLTVWIGHYLHLGVPAHRFHLAFHAPPGTPQDHTEALLEVCRDLGVAPAIVTSGPWHEHTNTVLRDRLRAQATGAWHLLADSDEFQVYPEGGLATAVREATGTGTVAGLLLDRVAADGTFAGWDLATGLDEAFPLGGFLTHHVLRGDPRKITLARSGVPVASGNHRSPAHRPVNPVPVCVHHFKWRAHASSQLRAREAAFVSGRWLTDTPALAGEYRRLAQHLDTGGGRIDVTSTVPLFRAVSLTRLPEWWEAEAAELHRSWRPPTTLGA